MTEREIVRMARRQIAKLRRAGEVAHGEDQRAEASIPGQRVQRCRTCGRTEAEHGFTGAEQPHGFWPALNDVDSHWETT